MKTRAALRTDPYFREHKGLGGTLVFLTKPAQEGLAILPDGSLEWRPMVGVSGAVPHEKMAAKVTPKQRAVMEALAPVWP